MKNKFSAIHLVISLIIVVGFVLSGVTSFFSFQTLFRHDVKSVSELTCQNIYANISVVMDRPVNVSLAMGRDTFLRDFVTRESAPGLAGDDLAALTEYLSVYQRKYQFDSVFFVSAKTGNYYHYRDGIDRVMTPDDPENDWYYDFLNDPAECSLNVDNDVARDNVLTVFVNCKLHDENQKLLGVVGVGIETPYVQQILLENEEKYGIHAYLIDQAGNIQLSSQLTEFEGKNLFTDEALQEISIAIDTSTTVPNEQWYHSRTADGYIITRYVPNLNWYLVVEKNTTEFNDRLTKQMGILFLSMTAVVGVVLWVISGVIGKYNKKLTGLAEIDQLTGIQNRTSYERELALCADELLHDEHFSIGVMDLDRLKSVNDRFGHQAGDAYIKVFSTLLCQAFDGCDVFRIGGDEFAVILGDMPEDSIQARWQKLSADFTAHSFGIDFQASASFGYASWDGKELDTVEKIFKKADDNMYADKAHRKQSAQNFPRDLS